MNTTTRLLSALLLLSLAACGGGAGAQPAEVSVSIVWGTPPNGLAAWTDLEPGAATVTVSTDPSNFAALVTVLAHELGHAVGLHHSPDTSCLMAFPVNVALSGPCDYEKVYMESWGAAHTLVVVACPGALAADLVKAINLWNTPSAFRSFNGSQGE